MKTTDYASTVRNVTQAEMLAEARERFGDDPMAWAFICPNCGDTATGLDFRQALTGHPRTNRDGGKTTASDLLGQECIGRTSKRRGCDWAAYGLFCGPWFVELPDGRKAPAFALAEVPATTITEP